jgi:hypothetical protein
MELARNIFFNTDKLVQGKTVKICYVGKFFRDHGGNVFLELVFDDPNYNQSNIPMKLTDLGYQAQFTLPITTESLNLYFKDDEGEVDNNNGINYSFDVQVEPFKLGVIDQTEVTYLRKYSQAYSTFARVKMFFMRAFKFLPRVASVNSRESASDQNKN